MIFTDDMNDPESGRTGVGVHVATGRLKQSFRASDKLSVLSVERLAIESALKWIEENKNNINK